MSLSSLYICSCPSCHVLWMSLTIFLHLTSEYLLFLKENKHLSVPEVEMSRLGAIVKILKDTSRYHSSKFSDGDVDLVLKLLNTWPIEMIFPGDSAFLSTSILCTFLYFINFHIHQTMGFVGTRC